MTEQQDRRATVRVGGRSDGSVEAAAAKRRPGMLTFAAAAAAAVVFVATFYSPQRNSLSRANTRGRSPPRPPPNPRIRAIRQKGERDGDAIGTEVQRSLRSR